MDKTKAFAFSARERDMQTKGLSDEEFERIYTLYCKRVYGYFLCRTGSAQSAEDLTADLFVRVLDKYGRYDAGKLTFEAWLFGMAKYMAVDFYRVHGRRAARTTDLDEALELEGGDSPERLAIEDERANALRNAILQLPEKQRGLVSLRYAAGLKNTEIASITGMTESNVGVALHLALARLRKILIKMGVDADG